MSFTIDGLTIPTLEEIREEIKSSLRADVSEELDLSPSSPMGQTVDIFARQTRLLWEGVAAVYAATNPRGASGRALDNLALLTGTTRAAATKSRVQATVNLDAGTYAAGALIAHVAGKPNARFVNVEAATAVSTGDVVLAFESEETGEIEAPSGTLTVIAEPVSGWNSVTNASDATLGSDIELDADLRLRREAEVTAQGSTTVDAIRADILRDVPGVISATVLENDTGSTVGGVAPYSIEAIVYGPVSPTSDDDQAVADQIFASKAADTGTTGTTTKGVTDAQGFTRAISFTRPTEVSLTAELTVDVDTATYPGDSELQTQVAAAAVANLTVGDDLNWSDLVAWAMEVPGVLRVTNVSVAGTPFANAVINIRQIVDLPSGDITVSSSAGTP